jgi:CHASE2 domain-containing sensor protein
LILSLEGTPLLHAQVATEINGIKNDKLYRGSFTLRRTHQTYINYRPVGSYPSYSFLDVAEGRVPVENLANKIVIVGRDTRAFSKDYVMTPYSRDALGMTRTEVHANILDTLILNNAPVETPPWMNLLVTCVIAILTVFVVLTLRPARGLLVLGVALATFSLVAWMLFAIANIWLDV